MRTTSPLNSQRSCLIRALSFSRLCLPHLVRRLSPLEITAQTLGHPLRVLSLAHFHLLPFHPRRRVRLRHRSDAKGDDRQQRCQPHTKTTHGREGNVQPPPRANISGPLRRVSPQPIRATLRAMSQRPRHQPLRTIGLPKLTAVSIAMGSLAVAAILSPSDSARAAEPTPQWTAATPDEVVQLNMGAALRDDDKSLAHLALMYLMHDEASAGATRRAFQTIGASDTTIADDARWLGLQLTPEGKHAFTSASAVRREVSASEGPTGLIREWVGARPLPRQRRRARQETRPGYARPSFCRGGRFVGRLPRHAPA